MAEDVRQWLKDLGCEHYHPIFIQNGFTSVAALGLVNSHYDERFRVCVWLCVDKETTQMFR